MSDAGVTETVEITGHLMDTGVLARVLDDILEYGGDYIIEQVDLGHEQDDESYAGCWSAPTTRTACSGC